MPLNKDITYYYFYTISFTIRNLAILKTERNECSSRYGVSLTCFVV